MPQSCDGQSLMVVYMLEQAMADPDTAAMFSEARQGLTCPETCLLERFVLDFANDGRQNNWQRMKDDDQ